MGLNNVLCTPLYSYFFFIPPPPVPPPHSPSFLPPSLPASSSSSSSFTFHYFDWKKEGGAFGWIIVQILL